MTLRQRKVLSLVFFDLIQLDGSLKAISNMLFFRNFPTLFICSGMPTMAIVC